MATRMIEPDIELGGPITPHASAWKSGSWQLVLIGFSALWSSHVRDWIVQHAWGTMSWQSSTTGRWRHGWSRTWRICWYLGVCRAHVTRTWTRHAGVDWRRPAAAAEVWADSPGARHGWSAVWVW